MKKITIFAGCACNCQRLEDVVNRVLKDTGLQAEIEKVMDAQKLAMAGIFSPPALAVDGAVKVTGRVPKPEEVENWLKD